MSAIKRIWLFCLLPWRVLEEIFFYILAPNGLPTTLNPGPKFSTDHGERKARFQESVKFWWNSASANVVVGARRSFSAQIVEPLITKTYDKHVLMRTFAPDFESKTPLLGARILDVRCGAGFLTEALADAGAEVTGIDTDETVIMTARAHWKKTHGKGSRPTYLCMGVQQMRQDHADTFDIVICSQLLENVPNAREIVHACCKLVRKGGCVLITAPNRTFSSFSLQIVAMEHVAAVLPYGTHRFFRFQRAKDAMFAGVEQGCSVVDSFGFFPVCFAPFRWLWKKTEYQGLWFGLILKKNLLL